MKKRRVPKERNDTSSKGRFIKKLKREPKILTSGLYSGIEYDSLDELAMLQWLHELKAYGYIKKIERSESFLLCDSLVNNFVQKVGKVSSKPAVQTLLHGHSYTPEFKVLWEERAREKFVHLPVDCKRFEKVFVGTADIKGYNSLLTYIEVKPIFDQNNMERLFKINQKWMWDKHKIFVNLVKVQELFPKTFTPKAYLTTPTGRVRIMKWEPTTLTQYLNKDNNGKTTGSSTRKKHK